MLSTKMVEFFEIFITLKLHLCQQYDSAVQASYQCSPDIK